MATPTDRVILTTCPRDCYDACGIAVVERDGMIRHVRGDPNHPVSRGKLCRKCSIGYNGAFLDPKARLTRPLRRVGAKGEGRFEPVSWDEALGAIAERLRHIVETTGAHTILNTHYTGTFSLLAFLYPMRFFNRLGATEIDPDTICNKAGHVALKYGYGTSLTGFDPRSARDAACILVWGANPSASAPHAHDHWLPEAQGTVIVVDPMRTPTAAAADLHLQPFPGSDAALAFALLHVIVREGLVDRDFVHAHTVGWDELEPLIVGCTPEWGEAATGVPARLIEQAAKLYGAGPSLLWIGQGLQRQRTGGNVVRACSLLPAVSGNLGKPGAGFLYLNGTQSRGIDEAYVAGAHLARDPPTPISHMDLVECLDDPARSQALFCWNINIAASNPKQAKLHESLRRENLLTVAIDLFSTDTTDFADYVLPAASFLEFDDLVFSYFHLSAGAQVKAAEPMGESLTNMEIFRRLSHAMAYTEPELYESDANVIATVLARSGLGVDFATLAGRGTLPVASDAVIQFADLVFPTPSGRVELASSLAEVDGLPRVPLPLVDTRPQGDRLRLLTPASPWLMNDSFANDRKIAGRLGQATVALHPDDAAERGLVEGDAVTVQNDTGRLELLVTLSDAVPRGVAYSPKGRWPKREPTRANVNALNPGERSDMGDSSSVHGVEVTVARA
ncbi:MAG TPA: molybdopterin-dependent oxidoreductase [Polyangiaceae bacterium]|nr:molybdopterin-dependent oxidoreductase [Polyangiaceae bacterium]